MPEYADILLPPVALGARIGILGGSFDPPHLCHELLALSFLALEPIDELWIIPCANHAVKKSTSPFFHRLAMCKLAFGRLNHVRVLDLEDRLPAPSFTVQTIQTIKALRPDLNLVFGLGSDLVTSFPSWHEADKLSALVEFVIFERENYAAHPRPELLTKARLHQGYVLPDANSTTLRDALRMTDNRNEPYPFLDLLVLDYLERHGLYGSRK